MRLAFRTLEDAKSKFKVPNLSRTRFRPKIFGKTIAPCPLEHKEIYQRGQSVTPDHVEQSALWHAPMSFMVLMAPKSLSPRVGLAGEPRLVPPGGNSDV